MDAKPFLLVMCILVGAACGSESRPTPDGGAPLDAAADAGRTPHCDVRARWIYLLDRDGSLLRFEPDTATITPLADLACSEDAYSMAIDHEATAHALLGDFSMQRVSTVDGACEATGYRPGGQGFRQFGMAFVGEGEESEGLFIAGERGAVHGGGVWLARLDGAEFLPIGRLEVPPAGRSPELTGTGTGELWAFFPNGIEGEGGSPDPCRGGCELGARCEGSTLTTCAPDAFGCLVETTTDCAERADGTCEAADARCAFTSDPCEGIAPCVPGPARCEGNALVGCETDGFGCLRETRTDCVLARDGMSPPGFCDSAGEAATCRVAERLRPLEGLFFRRFDPETGATLATLHVTEGLPETFPSGGVASAWAMAFWGGRLYVFLALGGTSQIYRVRIDTGEVELVNPDAGYTIVGAGVSTCAPTDLI